MYRLVLFYFFLTCFPASGLAAYPTPQSKYLNDFAGVFNPEEHSKITGRLREIKASSGSEIKVVTISSYKSYQTGDKSWEAFSKGLFRAWKIGGSDRNKGILFLVSTHDRKIRIQIGSGYPRHYRPAMKSIIDTYVTPPLRRGDFFSGVSRGVDEIYATINPNQPFIERYKVYLILGFFGLCSCGLSYIVMKMKSMPPMFLIILAIPGFCIIGLLTGAGGNSSTGGGGGGGASGGF